MSGGKPFFAPSPWMGAALCLLIFLLCGLAMIPYPGLHNDEVFFSGPLYEPAAAWFSADIGSAHIPFMVMSYSGALKTWIYGAIFHFFLPNKWTVRVPVLLMGVVTLWLTWIFTRRVAGNTAGLVTLGLLATDTTFLMTNIFDWGPVALQHLLLLAGLVLVRAWVGTGATKWLALGFFFWGVGMWDKALLAWPLFGLMVGALVVWPRQFLRHCRPRALAAAAISFCLGAAPLIWYNVARPGETARQNTRLSAPELLPQKLVALRQGIEGYALWGYIANQRTAPAKREPGTNLERGYAAIARAFGTHYSNWMLTAWLLGLGCFGLLFTTPSFRLLLFLLLTTLVAWLQMFLNKDTGASTHHVVLLWPFPAIFLGVAFSAVARRMGRNGFRALALVTALFCAGNLLNANEYLYNLSTRGASGVWTDAIDRLSADLETDLNEDKAIRIGAVDWGFLNAVRLLHDGEIHISMASDLPTGPINSEAQKEFLAMIGDPRRLFVRHTDEYQVFPGINQRFRQAVEAAGFTENIERIVTDSNQRPVFVVFRLAHEKQN